MPEVLKRNNYQTVRAGYMGKTFTISKESNTDKGYDFFMPMLDLSCGLY